MNGARRAQLISGRKFYFSLDRIAVWSDRDGNAKWQRPIQSDDDTDGSLLMRVYKVIYPIEGWVSILASRFSFLVAIWFSCFPSFLIQICARGSGGEMADTYV